MTRAKEQADRNMSGPTRRDFLAGTGAAVLAGALPGAARAGAGPGR
ncbi:MAG: twin-arginine translocation signal domain-containing protein, partial [Terriglobales bacterium]